MQSDKIVGKQIWLTFFHILVCIKYCSTFSKARKHFFQNRTKHSAWRVPPRSLFTNLRNLWNIVWLPPNPEKSFFFPNKKKNYFPTLPSACLPIHSATDPTIHSTMQCNEGGWEEATLVSLFVFRQQREPSEQRKKLNDFTFEIMTSRQRVGADGSLGGHLS